MKDRGHSPQTALPFLIRSPVCLCLPKLWQGRGGGVLVVLEFRGGGSMAALEFAGAGVVGRGPVPWRR